MPGLHRASAPSSPRSVAEVVYDTVTTPLGEFLLAAEAGCITGSSFETYRYARRPTAGWRPVAEATGPDAGLLAEARAQVEAYFTGRLTAWDLPLRPRGTAFQLSVLSALRKIQFGATINYAELARLVGRPAAVRAVGGANARNPIPLLIPCHRVIGADGTMTGFGGGVERKEWLLRHEGAR